MAARPQEARRAAGGEIADSTRLGDLRFRAFVPEHDWARLPPAIRRRFTKRLAGGATLVYVGRVVETRLSRAGWCLAQIARLIGAPFPLHREAGTPSVVTVTEDGTGGGQIWTRLYARRAGFPQVIHSAKRFAGPTGLEEHVGRGVGMTLTAEARDGALIFRSRRYFVELFGRRLYLLHALAPGTLCVTHAESGEGHFTFTLEVTHRWLGELILQTGEFREVEP